MLTGQQRIKARKRRHRRVRKKVFGTPQRPRLVVFRSNMHIYAQIVDDTVGKTLASASTTEKECRKGLKHGNNTKAAEVVGQTIAKRAVARDIKSILFDRGGYRYHGRIKALADGARQAGLIF